MRNRDKPAMPTPDIYHPDGQVEYGAPGMTKREEAVFKIAAGMMASPNRSPINDSNISGIAKLCIKMADEIFDQLDKEKT